jgi:hypothetical protein
MPFGRVEPGDHLRRRTLLEIDGADARAGGGERADHLAADAASGAGHGHAAGVEAELPGHGARIG